MKWILIRHGQTQGNREHRYIGCRTDEPLCPEGIAQLQNRHYPPVSRVFVSPMRRCVETENLLYTSVQQTIICLLYPSDAADDKQYVDHSICCLIKKQTKNILMIGITGSIFQIVSSLFLVYFVFDNNEYSVVGIGLANTCTQFFEMCCYLFILREDLKDLYSTESSQKLFLLKKSMPLFAQEILEGSIFNVGVTALLARLGIVSFSAYSVCRRLVDLCLTPMFMYCNGVVVLTGEYMAEKNKNKLLNLPFIALTIILIIYLIIAAILYIIRPLSIAFFTNKPEIIERASSILLLVLFTSIAQPFFEVAKFNLQAVGKEKIALVITGVVNLLIFGVLIYLKQSSELNLKTILLLLSCNYLVLYLIFTLFYRLEINKIIH